MASILFLDIDGVLNHVGVWKDRESEAYENMQCPDCLRRLFALLDKTNARVVLSSSWRGMPSLEERLARTGVMSRVIGRTPHKRGDDEVRGHEIAAWLKAHPAELGENGKFAIVDDDSDMLPEQMPFFVQTKFENGGLLDEHCIRLEALLL